LSRPGYGEGFIATFLVAVGALMLVYGLQMIALNLLQAAGVVLLAIGGYTLIFSASTRADRLFFAVWGAIASGMGASLALYVFVNPIISLGLILILLGVLGIVAMMRRGEG
jgi:uncharacterized membrane protein